VVCDDSADADAQGLRGSGPPFHGKANLPWVVRYTIDGRHRSKSFRTRVESERYGGLLLQSVQAGGRFDETTGKPESWQTPLRDVRVHDWSRRWLAEQWQEWQPRTRASATEALARFIAIAVEHGAKIPKGLRVYLYSALSPDSEGGRDAQHERWMAKNCLPLGELDRARIADIDRKLGLKLDGSPMAANTANRIRIIARASVQSAMEADAVAADAWPRRSKTRARRKVARTRRRVDARALPSPAAMSEAIDAIVTQQPASKTYRVLTAVAYYAGLRPSEVVMLRVRSVDLPTEGWGRLDVTEADISFDEPGEPKPARAACRSHRCSSRSSAAGSNRTTSRLAIGCCSELATTPAQAARTGPAHGTARSSRSARSRCGSTTVDTQPRPRGSAPACPSVRRRDDSGTASKHSSPPS
jgi:integrase